MKLNNFLSGLTFTIVFFFSLGLPAQTYKSPNSAGSGIIMRFKVTGAHALPAKTKIGVLPFIHEDGKTSEFSKLLATEMSRAVDRSGTFVAIERVRLDAIIQEMMLSAYGLVDTDLASRMGKLQGADALVLGELFEDGNYVKISARLVSVETGLIIASTSSSRIKLTPEWKQMIAQKIEPTPNTNENSNDNSDPNTNSNTDVNSNTDRDEVNCGIISKTGSVYTVNIFLLNQNLCDSNANPDIALKKTMEYFKNEVRGTIGGFSECKEDLSVYEKDIDKMLLEIDRRDAEENIRFIVIRDPVSELKNSIKTNNLNPSRVRMPNRTEFSLQFPLSSVSISIQKNCEAILKSKFQKVVDAYENREILDHSITCKYGKSINSSEACATLNNEF